ncbi:MAG TPA: substrate-binding domain-containing protein [Gemmatimonadaceae bacterium]|nr:substrate-binding domain-containing protein [Gemmatimonadaceae bacterium]
MRTTRRPAIAALLLALVASACSGGDAGSKQPSASAGSAGKMMTIAVIPKGTTHEFWRAIHAGAEQAAQELTANGDSVRIIWKGPLREDDREQQVQVVEGFTSQGVSGIVLAPLDNRALVRPVEEAKNAGVPTVIFDSGLESEQIVSFVATDNYKGGELCAERLGTLLGGKGKVLLLRYQEGSASTAEREKGFADKMKSAFPGIILVSSDQYAGATRETAKRTSENLLNRYGNELTGIFTPNESSTDGMLLALQDIGKAGKIRLVGFDASKSLLAAMKAKQLDGVAVQNPMKMGYLGVKTMVSHLRNQPVEKRIDTGVTLVTPENMDEPAIVELTNPPVGKYLSGQ